MRIFKCVYTSLSIETEISLKNAYVHNIMEQFVCDYNYNVVSMRISGQWPKNKFVEASDGTGSSIALG